MKKCIRLALAFLIIGSWTNLRARPPAYLKVLKEDHFGITYLEFKNDSVRAVCECFAMEVFSGTFRQVSDSFYRIYLSDDRRNQFNS